MAIRKGTNVNNLFAAGTGGEQFDGLLGYDVVAYATAAAGVTIDLLNASLNRGSAAGDTFKSIEAFRLSAFNDTFDGSAAAESVNGGFGNDNIDGRAGNDQVAGHNGNDTLSGGDGHDGLWGGGGNDIILGGDGNDRAFGDSGNDAIDGGAGNDIISGGFDGGRMSGMVVDTTVPLKGTDGFTVPLSVVSSAGQSFMLQGWQGHSSWSPTEVPLTKVGEVDGNSIYVLTNNSSSVAYMWGFQVPDSSGASHVASSWTGFEDIHLQPGQSVMINVGALGSDGGQPRSYNSWLVYDPEVKSSAYNLTDAQMSSNAVAGGVSITVNSLIIGDTLTGGAGADTFAYVLAHGVDRITDFTAGVDHIDLASNWFDGNSANGEFAVANHAGGAVIVFTDTSADGLVNNAAIQLAGIAAASVNASFFI